MPVLIYVPLQPAGVTPASAWTPNGVVTQAEPPIMLATAIDPQTGERLDVFSGQDPIPAAIQRQFRTRRGTGIAVTDDGFTVTPGAKNDNQAASLLRGEAQRILKPFVDAGYVRVDSITATAGPSAGNLGTLVVEYTDMTTGQKHQQPPQGGSP